MRGPNAISGLESGLDRHDASQESKQPRHPVDASAVTNSAF